MTLKMMTLKEIASDVAVIVAAFFVRNAVVLGGLSLLALIALVR